MDLRVFSFVVSAIFGLSIFLVLGSPKEGEQPKVGFNLVLHRGENKCFHAHHWMTLLLLSIVVCTTVFMSQGCFNPYITGSLGFMAGASLADLRYTDFLTFSVPCDRRT